MVHFGPFRVDLERLLAVSGTALDVGYVRYRIVKMLGEGDPRVETWIACVVSTCSARGGTDPPKMGEPPP